MCVYLPRFTASCHHPPRHQRRSSQAGIARGRRRRDQHRSPLPRPPVREWPLLQRPHPRHCGSSQTRRNMALYRGLTSPWSRPLMSLCGLPRSERRTLRFDHTSTSGRSMEGSEAAKVNKMARGPWNIERSSDRCWSLNRPPGL